MRELRYTVWLCMDCTSAAHHAGVDYETEFEPLTKIEGRLTPDYCPDHYWEGDDNVCAQCDGAYGSEDDGYEEFSTRNCDGCESRLAGTYTRWNSWEKIDD